MTAELRVCGTNVACNRHNPLVLLGDQGRLMRRVHKSGTSPNIRILGDWILGHHYSNFFWRGAMMPTRAVFRSNKYATFVECFKQNSGKSRGGKQKLPTADSSHVLRTTTTQRLLEIGTDPTLRVSVFDFRRVVTSLPNKAHDWWQRSPFGGARFQRT